MDDDTLMERYAGGEAGAFDRLYGRYEERVYGFCLRQLGDPHEAADAFQDTWRRVVDGRHRYEPRGRFESWLFTLARRACVDLLRSRPVEETSPDPAGEGAAAAAGAVPSADASPARRTVRRDELRRLLALLTDEQREALLLSKYEGFSYAEAARIIGSTEAAVKQRVYRALRRLREEPAREADPEDGREEARREGPDESRKEGRGEG